MKESAAFIAGTKQGAQASLKTPNSTMTFREMVLQGEGEGEGCVISSWMSSDWLVMR